MNSLRLKGNKKEKPQQGPLVLPGVNATSTMKSSRPTGSIIGLTKPTVTNLPGRTPGGSTIIGRSPRAMQQNAARQQATYQTNLAKNAATVSSGLKPQTSQYINVETPGGTIGYDAAQYKPVVDENGVVTGVTQNTEVVQPTQPTNPVRTLVDRGMFKQSETNPTKLVLDESKVSSKVEERRNQRLIDMGVDPNSEVVKLIEQGGKYDGTDAIGSTPYIRMPDGTRVAVEGYSGEKIQTLSNNKDQFDTATIKNEVKDEFKDTYTGTDSSVAGTSQGTQATTTDTTGMSGSSTSLATQAGLGQKYDLTPFQTTQSSIADLQSQIKNLSPDLQAAVLPSLMALQASSDLSMKTAAALISNLPTDQEITAGYGTLENYILDQDAKYKDIIEKNKQQSLAVANYNRDALELEKKLNDHNAYVAEQQQAQKNIDTEKGLRRQLNKLGIQTDTSGLDYLNTQLQRGVDALNNLKTANSLVSLRAQLAIGEGYKLDVKNALNTYEANYLQISSQTAEALRSVKKDIAMRIDDRDKEIRSILEKAVEKKSKNDADAADKIYQANIKMIESKEKIAFQDTQDARADKRMAFQERMAKERLIYSEAQADRRYAQGKIDDEMAEAKQVRAAFRTAEDQPEVKNYVVIRDAYSKAKNTLDAAVAGGKKLDIGVAKEIATVLYEKGLDPSSVVKEGEYLRASKGQGWFDNLQLFAGAVANGDQTGITAESAQAFMDAMAIASETQRASALSRYVSDLNYLQDFNTRSTSVNVDPRTVSIPPELLRPEDLKAFQSDSAAEYDYNYGSYSGGLTNDTYEEDPQVTKPLIQSMPETGQTMDEIFSAWNGVQLLSSPVSLAVQQSTGSVGETISALAPVTQDFNSSISTAHYAESTVKAWNGAHRGLDIAFPAGTFMPSVTDGILEKVEYSDGGWGLTAVVRAPDGAEIRYSHLFSIDPTLTIGSQIQKGREIAQIGNTGNVFSTTGSDGTHLDIRIKKNGTYIDPFSYYS